MLTKKLWDYAVTYYLSTSNISDSIIDNNYIGSAPPKTFTKVDILYLIHILLLV